MPFVIPYFIPHQGCPHQCLFCNQNSITGKNRGCGDVKKEIEDTITLWSSYQRKKEPVQFAFYGGSFTCLPVEQQIAMLETVRQNTKVDLIRLSTRPDCIDKHICDILREYGVGIVELGVQSLDDEVLSASLRGHNAQACVGAVTHLREAGMQIGIQLMPGLPRESRTSFLRTVSKVIDLRPDFVRIYPALVLEDSGLAVLYQRGRYQPLTLDMAVILTARARGLFLDAGIGVVRMGLQPSPSLKESIVTGPYHPAFGELVLAREWLMRVRRLLLKFPEQKMQVTISTRDLSSFNGPRKSNRLRLQELGLDERLEVKVDKNMERGKMHYVVC
ncbi:elongator complex protein 3 [Desulfopila inferna]|uniref:elongator complex protein 3 n=1 Tax=Desulfopila inferna TaxID=468528 RepID=UPI0019645F44|nr:radical SAM protein [Desulfopila inferna]MBM9604743.1 radical SAM protein [Desulfopila inferna]